LPAIDTGARLENVVFLHLRREHGRLLQGEIAYSLTASGREVDFVVGDLFEQRAARRVWLCLGRPVLGASGPGASETQSVFCPAARRPSSRTARGAVLPRRWTKDVLE
jgi:hypothetical protein